MQCEDVSTRIITLSRNHAEFISASATSGNIVKDPETSSG